MSSRSLTRLFFPNAPDTYQQSHQAEVQRSFLLFLQQLQNPGDARNTNLTLTNLQSGDDQGLETGAVYEKNGVLKISLANEPNLRGSSATGSVGSVTVTIS